MEFFMFNQGSKVYRISMSTVSDLQNCCPKFTNYVFFLNMHVKIITFKEYTKYKYFALMKYLAEICNFAHCIH